MGIALALGPTGRLRVSQDDETEDAIFPKPLLGRLQSAFAESNVAGLLVLTAPDWSAQLPATLVFWRSWGR